MGIDLAVIWFVIIIFATLMYIVMDGFDLGVGILLPLVGDRHEKDIMVNSVAPVWDGNETWLVLGGAALFGAFPLAYAVIIDALAIPLTFMLVALIFRGLAFEFRFKAFEGHRKAWDRAFAIGSVAATFFLGVVLGAVISGFPVIDRSFAGSRLDWLAPFPLLCGVGLVVAYGLLGSSWLIMKTQGHLQQQMFLLSRSLLIGLLVAIVLVSIWTPLAHPQIAERWFSLPNLIFLSPVPLLTALLGWNLYLGLQRQDTYQPFVMTLLLVLLGFCGLGISIWPYIIPPGISIWQASAPPQSQGFMLVGALFIIPIILVYTCWTYYVFRGKVSADEAYH
ncbi:cytochrome d ubiquinol oxidase subunit II [Shewanella algae]|uniref:cytochrome d ubiquinol oxidase subunit II n=1 Tax=Shewanella algae TaxID=38313 RepID=UPI001AAF9A89|nr:cytochrome d ubiquinol oxidase subunit II [Shewanella algae]MBO2661342.1 cytochrome d ubiquinol oxidase subunit II [Shewanella algae]MCL1054154.1 cytochrome d ubiquinol oxidase subunit II [Shewanella algae]